MRRRVYYCGLAHPRSLSSLPSTYIPVRGTDTGYTIPVREVGLITLRNVNTMFADAAIYPPLKMYGSFEMPLGVKPSEDGRRLVAIAILTST